MFQVWPLIHFSFTDKSYKSYAMGVFECGSVRSHLVGRENLPERQIDHIYLQKEREKYGSEITPVFFQPCTGETQHMRRVGLIFCPNWQGLPHLEVVHLSLFDIDLPLEFFDGCRDI